ncbi:uncharacterized protein LOC127279863 isoform X2 [Leptopilina boulardi]|uniref:uncharacterized protein LOC127279863 isoform X2 n=1 Tax=Leptopilina boulardi TaxID=63433 RepID=UPI0021F5B8C7|nr:uncharacterized protein LOC127279863 isoform X2 [Leptopilina boulardi]
MENMREKDAPPNAVKKMSLKNTAIEKAKGAKVASKTVNKMFIKNTLRVSSTGRKITTPKNILSTSDEETIPKISKKAKTVTGSLKNLKKLAISLNLETDKQRDQQQHSEVQKSGVSNSGSLQVGAHQTTTQQIQKIDLSKTDKVQHSGNQNAGTSNSGSIQLGAYQSLYQPKQKIPLSNLSVTSLRQNALPMSPNSMQIVNDSGGLTELVFLSDSTSNMFDNNNQDGGENEFLEFKNDYLKFKNDFLEFKNEVLRRFDNLENQNAEILHLLQLRSDSDRVVEETLYQPLIGFPIKTVEEFQALEADENKEIRQKVHDHLVRLGGSKLKEFLSCALKEVMADQLVTKFTWNKTSETEKFGDTKVSNIFYRAACKCSLFEGPANKEVYKLSMLDVLKSTKQRYRNKIKKSLQLPRQNEVEDDNSSNDGDEDDNSEQYDGDEDDGNYDDEDMDMQE